MHDFPTAPALDDDEEEPPGSTAPAWAIAGAAGVCYLVAAGLAFRWWLG